MGEDLNNKVQLDETIENESNPEIVTETDKYDSTSVIKKVKKEKTLVHKFTYLIGQLFHLLIPLLIIYGAMTNFVITDKPIIIMDENVREWAPYAFNIIERDLDIRDGVQNGIALTGELIQQALKISWNDYRVSYEGETFDLENLLIQLPKKVLSWFLIMIPVFFYMLVKISELGEAPYRIVFWVSSFYIPILITIGMIFKRSGD